VSEGFTSVVRLDGDVDISTRTDLRRDLVRLGDAETAVVDLSGVRYIDSSGITELLLIHRQRKERGLSSLRLVVPDGGNIARIVELTGLRKMFAIYRTIDEAVA
jgi:anti-anti-sigma factor